MQCVTTHEFPTSSLDPQPRTPAPRLRPTGTKSENAKPEALDYFVFVFVFVPHPSFISFVSLHYYYYHYHYHHYQDPGRHFICFSPIKSTSSYPDHAVLPSSNFIWSFFATQDSLPVPIHPLGALILTSYALISTPRCPLVRVQYPSWYPLCSLQNPSESLPDSDLFRKSPFIAWDGDYCHVPVTNDQRSSKKVRRSRSAQNPELIFTASLASLGCPLPIAHHNPRAFHLRSF